MEPGYERVASPEVDWWFERAFLESSWTCIWGRGCLGIHDVPTEHLGEGCCSVGAHLTDDEAPTISALAAMLEPARFQFHAEAAEGGVVAMVEEPTGERANTRVVEGACIFLNRPGFAGGAGCALHLGAIDDGEPPLAWKPSVCWQLPLHVDWEPLEGGRERATVRRWSRADWGDDGATMAWCCTEGERAYVGDRPVIDSLADELAELAGAEVVVELRRRLGQRRERS